MKSASTTSANLDRLVPAWKGLRQSTPFFGPIRNERDYARMQPLLDELLQEIGDVEDHPLADLLDVVGLLLAQYEIGTQGVVSEVLAGSRKINVRQAKALAQRFGVSPAVFF